MKTSILKQYGSIAYAVMTAMLLAAFAAVAQPTQTEKISWLGSFSEKQTTQQVNEKKTAEPKSFKAMMREMEARREARQQAQTAQTVQTVQPMMMSAIAPMSAMAEPEPYTIVDMTFPFNEDLYFHPDYNSTTMPNRNGDGTHITKVFRVVVGQVRGFRYVSGRNDALYQSSGGYNHNYAPLVIFTDEQLTNRVDRYFEDSYFALSTGTYYFAFTDHRYHERYDEYFNCEISVEEIDLTNAKSIFDPTFYTSGASPISGTISESALFPNDDGSYEIMPAVGYSITTTPGQSYEVTFDVTNSVTEYFAACFYALGGGELSWENDDIFLGESCIEDDAQLSGTLRFTATHTTTRILAFLYGSEAAHFSFTVEPWSRSYTLTDMTLPFNEHLYFDPADPYVIELENRRGSGTHLARIFKLELSEEKSIRYVSGRNADFCYGGYAYNCNREDLPPMIVFTDEQLLSRVNFNMGRFFDDSSPFTLSAGTYYIAITDHRIHERRGEVFDCVIQIDEVRPQYQVYVSNGTILNNNSSTGYFVPSDVINIEANALSQNYSFSHWEGYYCNEYGYSCQPLSFDNQYSATTSFTVPDFITPNGGYINVAANYSYTPPGSITLKDFLDNTTNVITYSGSLAFTAHGDADEHLVAGNSNPSFRNTGNAYYAVSYKITLQAGNTINAYSAKQNDSYLLIYRANGSGGYELVANDDDNGDGNHSYIPNFTALYDGDYYIVVTDYYANASGRYYLTVWNTPEQPANSYDGPPTPPSYSQAEVNKLLAFAAQGDNADILENNIGWDLSNPGTWSGVWWSDGSDKRVVEINFLDFGVSGSLDVSGFESLEYLNVNRNELTGLIVSGLGNLYDLRVNNNQLTEIDLSGLDNLQYLRVNHNQLTELDVSGSQYLGELYARGNKLTALDLSGLYYLYNVECYDQSVELTLTETASGSGEYSLAIDLNDPYLYDAAITYDNGVLTSTDNGVTSVYFETFANPTNYSVYLSGDLILTYVDYVSVTDVSLNQTTLELMEGESETLIATVLPDEATNKAVTWSSDDEDVATVDANGLVTAVGEGTATITVTTEDDNITAECVVTVIARPTYAVTFSVTGSNGSISATVDATAITTGATVAHGKNVVFTAVPASGYRVKAWTLGGTAVSNNKTNTYTLSALSAAAAVTVEFEAIPAPPPPPPPIAVTGVSLNKTTASLAVGGKETLTATVAPSNAANKAVTWLSSNTAVATVVNGVVTAVAVGTATITVKTSDGAKTATCAVTVSLPLSIASNDRGIPNTPDAGAAVIAPVHVTAFELVAGPNPVRKTDGVVNVFLSGKRINSGTLTVFDATGNTVRKIDIRDSAAPGKSGSRIIGSWDLRDAKGFAVSEGTYLLRGSVKTVDGKRERVSVIVSVR